ncbi:MAG: hypothetical protein LBN10_03380 [Propionibacteriaceae bacterium]|nr:hypothetical protein [Propionibacteriaceae bacterium]
MGEAIRLVERLSADPSSWLCASLNGWSRPISAETIVLADLYDLNVAIHTDPKRRGDVKPHPIRPWTQVRCEHYGNTAGRTRTQIEELLARARSGEFAEKT